MAASILNLPNGLTATVSPVFGGLYFKSNELSTHHNALPPGWTIVLQVEDFEGENNDTNSNDKESFFPHEGAKKHHYTHKYRTPTLSSDVLYISSISKPSSLEFKPATSPTREMAMMLWATLWWYFHQPSPNVSTTSSNNRGIWKLDRARGEWRINIKREGIFKGRHLLSKLERMGLITTEDSCVGIDVDDRNGGAMFVSQRAFWQLDPRIFLFTPSPIGASPYLSGSPFPSRPSSPSRDHGMNSPRLDIHHDQGLWSPATPGPFTSGSHLPTYYPPAPTQYVVTGNVRHPLRPKPPRQGETFYTRYIPSLGQYLSFRVASLSPSHVTHSGPVSTPITPAFLPPHSALTVSAMYTVGNLSQGPSDTELLHYWMNDPRVAAAWGVSGSIDIQENFLKTRLNDRHSFPAIGCWDGKPFGFFEIYWAKEDTVGQYVTNKIMTDWDRGFRVLVGENQFRGRPRVRVWLSALIHCCLVADQKTESIFADPKTDNEKFIRYLQDAGFQGDETFPSPSQETALMRITREAWEAPEL